MGKKRKKSRELRRIILSSSSRDKYPIDNSQILKDLLGSYSTAVLYLYEAEENEIKKMIKSSTKVAESHI